MKKISIVLSFSFLVLSNALFAQQTPTVYWHNGLHFSERDRTEGLSFFASELWDQHYYRLLSFDHVLSAVEQQFLSNQGIEILEYVPEQTYLCRIKQEVSRSALDLKGLTACFRLSAAHKLSRNLLYGNECQKIGESSKIVIQFLQNTLTPSCVNLLKSHSIQLGKFYSSSDITYAQVNDMQLKWLAEQSFVKFLDCESLPGVPEDREGQSLHRVNMLTANGAENIFLDGAGVKVMVRDDGFVGPHIDFQGRITNDVLADVGTHGDGVSGVLTGAGNYDPLVIGMAPGAELFVINYQPDFLDNTLPYHQNEGVVITNSSYSNGCNVGYTLEAQIVDKQLFENRELLHVFSAGNSNNSDCGYGAGNQWGNVTGGHKIGKNCLTVANLRLDGTLESSSSRGPTRDRRLKPEISARGTNQLSTAPDNGTLVFGGTSAAAPGVAGVCALLYQAYKNFNGGQNPESALIKAAVMNTATDIGTLGPDYQFGFGVINAYRAFKLIESKRYQKMKIAQGQKLEYKINIPANTALAKIMIYWPEKEASLLASKALINDLDCIVTDPSGTQIKPWVLDPSPNAATLAAGASKGTDTLNNFEQVEILAPTSGEYILKIDGKFIPSNEVDLFILYEFEDRELRLTYPIGGEQFNITESSQIHFTAYGSDSIYISLSTNGGIHWSEIDRKAAGARLSNFVIPNNVSSDSCLIHIRQGLHTVQSDFFTITSGVQGFQVSKYCPNELELSWNRSAKDSFLIYQLGEKYMEPAGISSATTLTLPNNNPRAKKWFSISGYEGTALSRRELAIASPDTLIGCNIHTDLGLDISANTTSSYYTCDEAYVSPVFKIINRSTTPIDEFTIYAQSDNGLVSETYALSIAPYDTLELKFEKGIFVTGTQQKVIIAWVEHFGDQNPYNDTLDVTVDLIQLPEKTGSYPMVEEFVASSFPSNWLLQNPLDNSTWNTVRAQNRKGILDNVLLFDNPNQVYRNQPIVITSKIADLSTAVEPYLYLDFAHHSFSTSIYQDSFRIVVKEVCGTTHLEKECLSGRSLEIKTHEATPTMNWTPVDTSWYWLAYDLSEFKGKKVVVEFQILRGHNNRTAIDKVEIREKYPETGTADFTLDPNPGCYSKQIRLTPTSDLQNPRYYFDAGLGGNPRYLDGPGPHQTRYTLQGDKRIAMHVKSDLSNDAITIKRLSLANAVSINYTWSIVSGRTVQFKNNSSNGETYLWTFGDGQTSTEFNPVHTYDSAKIYKVKLTITNPCGTYNRTIEVDLTITGTNDPKAKNGVDVYPNPTTDLLTISSASPLETIAIMDLNGKLIHELTNVRSYEKTISLAGWTAGFYQLTIVNKKGTTRTNFQKM
ncbi:MAG: S8 family serine peptidase [Saprospiraceae bacterium]|nr:S8 family serine peptidase [Saprospiraceae bacterium]